MKKCSMVIMVVALVGLLVGGCADSKSVTEKPSEEKANFRLLVSDEANDIGYFSSLNVTITKVALNAANETGGWIYPDVIPKTINLKLLTGDNATEIFSGYIASGNYTKIVLYTDNITGVLDSEQINSEELIIKLPSGKLQISKPFTVKDVGEDSIVNFVFDITVIRTGNGKFILKPQMAESGPDQNFTLVSSQGNTEQHGEKFELKHEEKHGKPEEPGKPER